MATTFFDKELGGKQVALTSFYGGDLRGRCMQLTIGGYPNSTYTEFTFEGVKLLIGVIFDSMYKRNTPYILKAGANSVSLNRRERRTMIFQLAKWMSGTYLKEI